MKIVFVMLIFATLGFVGGRFVENKNVQMAVELLEMCMDKKP